MSEVQAGSAYRVKRLFKSLAPIDLIVRGLLSAFHLTLRRRNARRRRVGPARLMLTGSFYSDAWIRTHLVPITLSSRVEEVAFVGASAVPDIAGVRFIRTPPWLICIFGQSLARLIFFGVSAVRERPDYLGGFHLQLNGIVAIWLARFLGLRSIYVSTGGPAELIDGGIQGENPLFGRQSRPNVQVESALVSAAAAADLIVTKGESAHDWFVAHCPDSVVAVIPGGFPMPTPIDREKAFDLIFVGRLSAIKRIDRLLEAVALLDRRSLPLKLVIVGDGGERAALEQLTKGLGIAGLVTFAGWQSDVDFWLAQSRLFVLTSDSEGLSQAVVQALIQGVPVVSSAVGDLRDVVKPNINGELVTSLTPDSFADAIQQLITGTSLFERYSANARTSVENLSMEAMASRWDALLEQVDRRLE